MGAGIPREMCWRESRTSDRRGWQCTSSSSRGSFLERYNNSRCAACESALDDCPVAEALHQMALGGVLDGSCEATASALLRTLASYTAPNIPRTAQWPKTPRSLSCTLRRIAPQLRQTGIRISFGRKDNRRIINISRKP